MEEMVVQWWSLGRVDELRCVSCDKLSGVIKGSDLHSAKRGSPMGRLASWCRWLLTHGSARPLLTEHSTTTQRNVFIPVFTLRESRHINDCSIHNLLNSIS